MVNAAQGRVLHSLHGVGLDHSVTMHITAPIALDMVVWPSLWPRAVVFWPESSVVGGLPGYGRPEP